MSAGVKVPLSAPIQAYGEEIDTLILREPTGKDIRDCGFPFRIHPDSEEMAPQAVPIARYISTLGKIPMGSVDRMSAADFNSCMGVIVGFFGESPGEPPKPEDPAPDEALKTSPAISPASSAAAPATS